MAKSDKDHAQQLLQMATMDHVALMNMMDPENFKDEIFGFHAQQAIEKALKAWIAVRGLEYPKTHDVSGLIKILKTDGAELSEFSHLEDYTPFAVQYRYELMMSDDALARNEVVEQTREFLDHVRRIVDSSP
jgi:HEPN domain-containing protein